MVRRLVKVARRETQLTPPEHDLLRVFVNNVGKVVTHNQLLRQVWGGLYEEKAHLVRVHISNLRAKREAESARPQYILTGPGVGYRLRMND
jgi:two-component system, OmpR family, KDP operon response regulator KdpE